jgi:potassium/hydrogen antiporter
LTPIDYILLSGSLLVIISLIIAKFSDNVGVPTLLLFIIVGMLAGSEGPGGIYFNDPYLAQSVGIIALIFILFSGGLDTKWFETRSSVKPALLLSTLGVFITALIVAVFITFIFEVDFMWGFLIGSIISSTDAAAVFSILRTRKITFKGGLRPLLELESGSNDPMAVFLTIGSIEILRNPETGFFSILLMFIMQMGIGTAAGYGMGKLIVFSINKLKFNYAGIYPVYTIAMCLLVYSVSAVIGGSGFLAVYISGIIVGNSIIVHKNGTIRFFDGLAVLSQITMFLTLGLLVFPSQVMDITFIGLLISGVLIFIARPASVFISLSLLKYNWREKLLISWIGLRGAVPIVLATFALIARIDNAPMIFNVVFFIVITSVILQGWTITPAAKLLKLSSPEKPERNIPLTFEPADGIDTELIDFIVPYSSNMIGKSIVELKFPEDSRIILIWRDNQSIVPNGSTVLESADTLLILVNKNNLDSIRKIFIS